MSCEGMRPSFLQMLASALVRNSVTGEVLGINAQIIVGANCEPAIDCDNNTVDVETMVVAHAFGVDANGNVFLRLVNCP